MNTKRCFRCKADKSLDSFCKDRTRKDGLNPWCRKCCKNYNDSVREHRSHISKLRYQKTREKRLKQAKEYREQKIAENPNWKKLKEMSYLIGKTFDEVETWFNKQWMKQQAQCAICGKVFCDDDCIDHNHETNELRGLLCSTCNSGIGFLKDFADLCLTAYNYLNNKIERK